MLLKIRFLINSINYCAFCTALLLASLLGSDWRFVLLLLYFVFLTNYTIRVFFLSDGSVARLLSACIDLPVICAISYLDLSGVSLILFLFIIDDAILSLHAKEAAVLEIAAYLRVPVK